MQRGIYETDYGNAAYVSGKAGARTAFDLDMQQAIPLSMVTDKFLRYAEPHEEDSF